jgi:hypothetical protein
MVRDATGPAAQLDLFHSPAMIDQPTMKAIVHERGRPDASSVNSVEWYGVTGPIFARIGSGLRTPSFTAVGGSPSSSRSGTTPSDGLARTSPASASGSTSCSTSRAAAPFSSSAAS